MTPEELAARCLVAAGVRSLPVDVPRILRLIPGTFLFTPDRARAMGAPPAALAALSPEVPAVTFAVTADGTRRRIVCCLPGAGAARLRMTLAHELGHIVCRHRGTGGREEREADAFARALLAPPCLLERLREEIGSVRALAWAFGLTAGEAERAFVRRIRGGERAKIPPDLADTVAENLLAPVRERLRAGHKHEQKIENSK